MFYQEIRKSLVVCLVVIHEENLLVRKFLCYSYKYSSLIFFFFFFFFFAVHFNWFSYVFVTLTFASSNLVNFQKTVIYARGIFSLPSLSFFYYYFNTNMDLSLPASAALRLLSGLLRIN